MGLNAVYRKYILERIDSAHKLTSRGGKRQKMQENQNRTNMAFVYASPERMSASHNEEGDTYEGRTYPFFHAAGDELDHTLIMKEVYGGPTFLSKSVSSSDVCHAGRAI